MNIDLSETDLTIITTALFGTLETKLRDNQYISKTEYDLALYLREVTMKLTTEQEKKFTIIINAITVYD